MRPLCEGAGFLDHEHQLEGPGRVVAAVAGLPERLLSGGWSGQGIVERPCLDVTHAVGRRRGLEAPGRRQKLDSHVSLRGRVLGCTRPIPPCAISRFSENLPRECSFRPLESC